MSFSCAQVAPSTLDSRLAQNTLGGAAAMTTATSWVMCVAGSGVPANGSDIAELVTIAFEGNVEQTAGKWEYLTGRGERAE